MSLVAAPSLSSVDSLVSAERRRSSGEHTSPVVLSVFTPVCTERAPETGINVGFSVFVCLCVSVRVCGCVGVCAAVSVVMATPERIELENCGWSSMTVEPEEVSEEILNQFNLSLDEKIYQKPRSKPQKRWNQILFEFRCNIEATSL